MSVAQRIILQAGGGLLAIVGVRALLQLPHGLTIALAARLLVIPVASVFASAQDRSAVLGLWTGMGGFIGLLNLAFQRTPATPVTAGAYTVYALLSVLLVRRAMHIRAARENTIDASLVTPPSIGSPATRELIAPYRSGATSGVTSSSRPRPTPERRPFVPAELALGALVGFLTLVGIRALVGTATVEALDLSTGASLLLVPCISILLRERMRAFVLGAWLAGGGVIGLATFTHQHPPNPTASVLYLLYAVVGSAILWYTLRQARAERAGQRA